MSEPYPLFFRIQNFLAYHGTRYYFYIILVIVGKNPTVVPFMLLFSDWVNNN